MVELELGTAVGVGGVDPLAAAEEPVVGVAASVIMDRGQENKTKPYEYYNEHGRPEHLRSSLNSARAILLFDYFIAAQTEHGILACKDCIIYMSTLMSTFSLLDSNRSFKSRSCDPDRIFPL